MGARSHKDQLTKALRSSLHDQANFSQLAGNRRGTDFSWMFVQGPVRDGTKWEQSSSTACDLSVGAVHASHPTQPSKWTTQVPAKIRQRTVAQQLGFLQRSGVTPDMFETDQ